MRTIEECQADARILREEMTQVVCAQAKAICKDWLEIMEARRVSAMTVCKADHRRIEISGDANRGHTPADRVLKIELYVLDGKCTRVCDFAVDMAGRWSLLGDLGVTLSVIKVWDRCEGEEQAERDELAFEAARCQEREDPDYVIPAPIDRSDSDLENMPDPFAGA